ncbi:unnamed protein product [Prunus armeniaca]
MSLILRQAYYATCPYLATTTGHPPPDTVTGHPPPATVIGHRPPLHDATNRNGTINCTAVSDKKLQQTKTVV